MKNIIKEFLSKFNNLIIATTVAIILVVVTFIYILYSPADRRDIGEVEIQINTGDSLLRVAQNLKEADLVRNKLFFIFYIKTRGEENELKAGRYVLSKSINIPTIARLIVSGKSESNDIKIVIPEGSNIWEIDKKLVQAGLTSEGQFSSKYYSKEGYLFPDTYSLRNFQFPISNFQSQELVEELKNKMTENFNNKTVGLFSGLSLAESKEIIIIASILGKEARTEQDMKLVSGIIKKRLERGMPLQIDATVIYGACLRNFQLLLNSRSEAPRVKNCDVTFQGPAIEIPIDGLYNSYIRKGLPSAPISNPGLQAIEAALNSTPSDYLYYLSTRDGSQMIYSKTPTEHAANRRKYLGI